MWIKTMGGELINLALCERVYIDDRTENGGSVVVQIAGKGHYATESLSKEQAEATLERIAFHTNGCVDLNFLPSSPQSLRDRFINAGK